MKCLITGGSGFIGTHLIGDLLSKGHQVTNLDLKSSYFKDNIEEHIIDIRDSSKILELKLGRDYDLCIHLAALCKEPGFEWQEYFLTNLQGTKNIVKLCEMLNIKKFFFTSTMMVFKASDEKRKEDAITAPDTAYGISKLLAEKELVIWKSSKGGRVLKIVRPAVVFGENEGANFTRLYRSLRIGFFPYIGRKTTIKSSIYVKEVSSFIDFLIMNQTSTDTFNLSFPERHEMKDIIEVFKEVFNFKVLTPVLPYRLMLLIAYFFEFLNTIGIRNAIHHRRIQKLYHSTHIYPQASLQEGYKFKYTLKSSLQDWKSSNDPNL